MMKSLKHILLCVLAVAALTVSCIEPQGPIPVDRNSAIPDDAVVFSPRVSGIIPATKATPGDVDRGENTVTRLDVFVYKTTGGTSAFHKHYTIGDGTQPIATNIDYLLESNWRTNYTLTDTYRIYAIANVNANKLRTPVFPESPDEADLLELTSESDKKIDGQYGYECYDIVRLKSLDGSSPAAGSLDHHIGDKLFLMDGMIDNWKISQSSARQYFTNKADSTYELSRAAAKFRVKLDFSDDFKESLGTDDGTGLKFTSVIEYYPISEQSSVQKKKSERIITIGSLVADPSDGQVYANGKVTGGARAKFANFLKATYDVTPRGSIPTQDVLDTFRDANLWNSQSFYEFSYRTPDGNGGYKYPYIDTSYSYAFSWEPGQAAEKAPALAVSIVYTTYIQEYNEDGSFNGPAKSDGGVTNYYRIPLVDLTKTGSAAINSIERNYYYQVDAEINTMGSSTTEIEPTDLHLKYKVIPWPDAPDELTEAQSVQLLYFVPEKEYRLRGDGLQSTYLQYFTPKSDPNENNEHFQATPKIRNVQVYYYDQDGLKRTIQNADPNDYTWTGSEAAGVTINVLSQANGNGRFYVASTALKNRSVKYIEFDAVVDFGYAGGQVVTQHIIVTHFPLDNIQSILGWWSSRWDGQPTSGSNTTYYRKLFYKTEVTPVTVTAAQWAAGVGNNNDNRKNANSEATAVNGYFATGGSSSTRTYDPNWYTVTEVTGYSLNGRTVTVSGRRRGNISGNTSTWSENYNNVDYVVSSEVSNGTAVTTLWNYSNYYHLESARVESYSPTGPYGTWTSYDGFEWEECTQAEYNNTSEENRKVEVAPNAPSTGTWVAYDPRKAGTIQGTTYSSGGSGFYAKVWDSVQDANRIHRITEQGRWGEVSNVATEDGKNNPHIYVIQISKAEQGVILGRPTLNNNYQSQDNVVSPAFMIASQLGAVNSASYDASTAAQHCHTYMEVAENGYRFVGWRLPTKAEIAYIVGYQNDPDIQGSGVFSNVLTGDYYYTLDGTSAPTYYGTGNDTFVRCIRDLTPKEVIELNNTGEITAASY